MPQLYILFSDERINFKSAAKLGDLEKKKRKIVYN